MQQTLPMTIHKHRVKRFARTAVVYIIMIFIALIMLAPFYFSLLISFRPSSEIMSFPMEIFPRNITAEHYRMIFNEMKILRHTLNTVLMTSINIFTNLVFCSLAAYAFAKLQFKFKNIIFKVMIAALMLPGIVTLVPTFMLIVKMNLTNTFAGVILPGSVGVYGIFFMRSFFLTLSDELREAGRIDGASEVRIFFNIYIPLVLPALITLGIFCLQGVWNSYVWPSIVLMNSPNKEPLAVALKSFELTRPGYGSIMAAAVMSAVPILVIFVIAQKYFINGVAVGGLKG